MSAINLLTLVGLKQKQVASNTATIDFLSVRIGTDNLEIKETAGAFDFSAAKLSNIANGSASSDAAAVGQVMLLTGAQAMTGAMDLGTHLIHNVVDPASPQDAATKAYADSLDNNNIKKDGSVAFTGNESMGGHKLTSLAAATANGDAVRFEQAVLTDGTHAITGNQSFSGTAKITNLVDPTLAQDGATKAYVDAAIAGLSWKEAAIAASVANVTISSAPATLDGVTLSLNDRVLLKDQTAGAENGIYIFNGAASALTRSLDADSWNEIVGFVIYVEQGTVNAGSKWVDTNAAGGTLGTTAITITTFAAASSLDGVGTTGYNAYWTAAHTLAAEQYVAAVRGGFATDVSAFTGVVKASSGTFSASTIVNADVAAGAAIARSKLAAGTADHVLINDGSGNFSSEAQLSVLRGGTNKSSWTAGSIVFAGTGGTALAENTGFPFSWDNTNNRFNVGATGTGKINVTAAGGSDLGLNVFSTSSSNAVQIQNQSSYGLSLINAANSALAGASIGGAFSRGTLASRTQSLSGDQIFSITGQGYTGSAFSAGLTNAISFVLSENTTSSAAGGEIVFSTTPNTTLIPVERMRIKQSGVVNIAGLTASLPVKTDASKNLISSTIVNADVDAAAAIAYSKLALTGSIVNADISASAAIAYSKLALTGAIVNADISASAAIAYSKLALTNSIVNADIASAAAIAYSKLALSNSIVNADINSAAAIAYSKLALTGAIVNADISASAGIVYSKLSLTGAIVNADISASAAIAYSKLALTNSIVNADIASAAAIAYSKLNLAGSIVNADVSGSAAIAYSKLALSNSIVAGDLTANSVTAAKVNTNVFDQTTITGGNAVAAAVNYARPFVNDNAGTITVGQLVYIKSNGHVDLARADTITQDTELGIVADATIATTATGQIYIVRGAIIGGFTSLTPGKQELVSPTTAGAATESTGSFVAGNQVYSVGRALSTTTIELNPNFLFEF